MTTFQRFEELPVWKTAKDLANLVYGISEKGSFARDLGLRDQIRRAAVSVMSTVAEGFDSSTNPLFRCFLARAKASAGEVKSQLYLAYEREYIDTDSFLQGKQLAENCSRQIRGLLNHLALSENRK